MLLSWILRRLMTKVNREGVLDVVRGVHGVEGICQKGSGPFTSGAFYWAD